MSDEYMIEFWAHGEYHEIAIDLECLAKALQIKQPKPSKRGLYNPETGGSKMNDCDGDCCACCHYGGHGKLEALESERDRLKAELEKSTKRNNSMCAELQQLKKCPECKVYEGVSHDEGCHVLLLLKDRDRLKAELELQKEICKAGFVDRDLWKSKYEELKSQADKLSCPKCGSDVDGKNWKSRAEKMAEALRKIQEQGDKHRGEIGIAGDMAKEALAESEKGGK